VFFTAFIARKQLPSIKITECSENIRSNW